MNTRVLMIISAIILINNLSLTAFPGSFKFMNKIGDYQLDIRDGVQKLGDSLIFLNTVHDSVPVWDSINKKYDNKYSPFFDLCILNVVNQELITYNLTKNPLTKQVGFIFDLAAQGNKLFFGTDSGLMTLQNDTFKIYKLDNTPSVRLKSLIFIKDTLFIAGNYMYLLKFYNDKLYEIRYDTTDGHKAVDWMPEYFSCKLFLLDNKLFYTNFNAKNIVYYDLEKREYKATNFNQLPQFQDDYRPLYLTQIDDKLYFLVYQSSNVPFIISYDGTNLKINNSDSLINKIAAGSDYFDLRLMYKIDSVDWIYAVKLNNNGKLIYYFEHEGETKEIDFGKCPLQPTQDVTFNKAYSVDKGIIYFTLLGGGFLVYDPNGTGVEHTDIPTIIVYNAFPNPVTNKIKIQFANWTKKFDEIQTELYDYLGRRIAILRPEDINVDPIYSYGTMQLDLSGVPNGAYYLIIKNTTDMRTVPVIKE